MKDGVSLFLSASLCQGDQGIKVQGRRSTNFAKVERLRADQSVDRNASS